MNLEAVFLDEIRAHPEDDVPRLVFADWLTDHGGAPEQGWADLIRVQCELAHLDRARRPGSESRRQELRRRERALLDELYEPRFRHTRGYVFRRGFLDEVHLDVPRFHGFFRSPEARQGWQTVRVLELRGVRPDHLDDLLGTPELRRVTHLRLDRAVWERDPLARIAREPFLAGLRVLIAEGCLLDGAGCVALTTTPSFAGLTHLLLGNNGINERGAPSLSRNTALARLEHLDLAENAIGNVGARALARARSLGKLRYLDLRRNLIDDREALWLLWQRHGEGVRLEDQIPLPF